MKFPDNHNDKVEIKFESQFEIFVKNFKNLLLSIIKPLVFICSIILFLYGLFYIALFFIIIFSLLYFYKNLKKLIR